jgi:chromosome segregation ATPase
MIQTHIRNRGAAPIGTLVVIGVVAAIVAVGYALYLLTTVSLELKRMSVKLDGLNNLTSEMQQLSGRLDLLVETNRKLAAVQKDTHYMPELAAMGNTALKFCDEASKGLELTNNRLAQTNEFFISTSGLLEATNGNMTKMSNQLSVMQKSVNGMSGQMEQMNTSVVQATQSVGQVDEGLGGMRNQLESMNQQLAALPKMAVSLDKTNAELSTLLTTLSPLAESMPQMNASLDKMVQTTADMSKSLKKLPKQGALGLGILTGATLLAK